MPGSYESGDQEDGEWFVHRGCACGLLVGWLASLGIVAIYLMGDENVAVSTHMVPIYGESPLPVETVLATGLIRQLALSSCMPRTVLEATTQIRFQSAVESPRSTTTHVKSTITAEHCQDGVIFNMGEVALYLLGVKAILTTPPNAKLIMQSLESETPPDTIDGMENVTFVFYPRTLLGGRVAHPREVSTPSTISLSNDGSGRRRMGECETLIDAPICYPMYYSCMHEWDQYYDTINWCKVAMNKAESYMYGGGMTF